MILDVVDLHDQDRIVTFLTADWGLKRGVARASRRKFSRFSGQLQILSRGSFRWFEKEDRDLVRIETVEGTVSPEALLGSLEGILVASYLCEHLVKFTQENEDSALYYRLLVSTVAAIESGISRSLAVRFYETWVLRLAGIFPPPTDCPHCGEPIASNGARLDRACEVVVCRDCDEGDGHLVSPQAVEFLVSTAVRRLDRLSAPGRSTLDEVEVLCQLVRRSFLGNELRSYAMMKSMVGDLDTSLREARS